MRLSEIGEEALIERISSLFHLPKTAEGLAVGIGDDAAVLSCGSRQVIVTTDMLIEDRHFLLDKITPRQLGWRAVAANISDVAAMGGLPTWTFISLALRPDMDVSFVDELYKGFTECASRFGGKVAGGDTNSTDGGVVINICQLGEIEAGSAVLRSTAGDGDRILVTGTLGDSRGGLELILKGVSEGFPELMGSHLTPVPRVSEARAAVSTGKVRAMMDLSDGLGADLPKLCRASGVGAVVYAENLPVSDELKKAAQVLGMDAIGLAAGGGEDFELLMTVGPEDAEEVIKAIESAGTQASEIGEITEGPVEIAYSDGSRKPLSGGWSHFTR